MAYALLQNDLLLGLVIILSSIVIAKIFWIVVEKNVRKVTSKTKTKLDDKLLASVGKPLRIGIVLIGVYLAVLNVEFLIVYMQLINEMFRIIGILFAVYFGIKLMDILISWHMEKEHVTRASRTVLLKIESLIHILIYIITILIILNTLGYEITPLVASLGIGGLAVALALQNTLSNYFAGIYITTDRVIKIGDYVELDNGIKGYVERVGWRSTIIKTLPNNIVIIPNSKLAETVITNYYEPVEEMSVVVPCGVSYNSDLEKVEKVTIDAATKIQKSVKGAVKTFKPFIRYNKFGDSNIEFSIILRVEKFVDQYETVHEFVKELVKAYSKHGIEISYPVRNVYMRKS